MRIRKPSRRAGVAAVILAALSGAASADDRCAAVRAMPGAEVRGDFDRIVIAPAEQGAFRFCFWNSPTSSIGNYLFDFSGETFRARVDVHSGPEVLTFDLPGAIPTDLDGVPLTEISAPDGEEVDGMLWRLSS